MSDPQSSPSEPLGYFVPGQMPKQRPASVTAVSVLAILIGAYGAMSLPTIFVMAPFRSWNAIWSNPGFGLLQVLYLDRFANSILGIILLVGGILALLLKPSGRRLLLYYSVLHVLFGLAGQIMVFAFLLPILAQPPPVTVPTTRITNVVIHTNMINFGTALRHGWFGAVPPVVAICVWSSVIIIVMTRANVKAAFEPDKR